MAIPLRNNLHNNAVEEAAFKDLIGSRRLEEVRAEKAEFEKEINDAIKDCGEIFMFYGASCNYIAELEALEKEIQTLGDTKTNDIPRFSDAYKIAPSPRDALLIKREQLLEEFATVLEKMSLTHQEDIEANTAKIVKRRGMSDENMLCQEAILDVQPTADEPDLVEIMTLLDPIFKVTTKITGEEYDLEVIKTKLIAKAARKAEISAIKEAEEAKTSVALNDDSKITQIMSNPDDLLKEEKILSENPKVIRIERASDTLINNAHPEQINEEVTLPEEVSVVPEPELDFSKIPPVITPLEAEEDISFFGNSLQLDEIIEEKPKEDNMIEVSDNSPFLNHFDDLSVDLISEAEAMVASATNNVNELRTFNVFEDTTPTVEPLSEFSTEVPEGWSLCDLAAMILNDDPNGADGWIDIYNSNFDKISEILDDLKKRGIEPKNGIQHDKKIFNGVSLEIPLVFTKGLTESNEIALVA